jgi:hypothetical protein
MIDVLEPHPEAPGGEVGLHTPHLIPPAIEHFELLFEDPFVFPQYSSDVNHCTLDATSSFAPNRC